MAGAAREMIHQNPGGLFCGARIVGRGQAFSRLHPMPYYRIVEVLVPGLLTFVASVIEIPNRGRRGRRRTGDSGAASIGHLRRQHQIPSDERKCGGVAEGHQVCYSRLSDVWLLQARINDALGLERQTTLHAFAGEQITYRRRPVS
jgi:hypothetical protein